MIRRPTFGLCLLLCLLSGSPSPIAVPADREDRIRAAPEPSTLELLDSTSRPVRDPVALVARVAGMPIPPAASEGPREPLSVGQIDSFFVLDQGDNTYKRREAELRVVTPQAYWYVELGQNVQPEELERSAAHFEQATYPTVHRYFGTEWSPGIDGDPRISVFLGTVPGVGAYFSSWDEYPRAVFPYSNEREIVLLNLGALRPGSPGFDGTLAHEFQHMVHWNASPSDETWVDEGSAELASSLAAAARGAGTNQFQRQPDVQLTAWSATSPGPHYEAAFLFMQYFAAQYGGPDGLRGLIGEQGRPPETFDRYLARAGYGVRFDEVFQDWIVANLLDDPGVGGGRYYHERSDPRIALLGRLRPDDPPIENRVHQYGADYVELVPGGDAEVVFEGEPTVRLAGADPTSGRKLWWSNRGDGLDSSITRRFDLSGVAGATLRFNLWYDTEKDYDYFYVMASRDDGASWQILRGALASDANPAGNAVGPGYSGTSGADAPTWVTEDVDLSPFAGGEVLVRFEYVTDQAYNAGGVLLDDVQIPEIGELDDAEGDRGWVADGFLRSDNTIPQRWGLRLIEHRRGGEVTVRPLAPGPDGRLTEPLGADVERAVLSISGLAPRTLESSAYRLTVRRVEPD